VSYREFERRYKTLRENYLAGRDITAGQQRELRGLWEAAERDWHAGPIRIPGSTWMPGRPPPWEQVATELGLNIAPTGKAQGKAHPGRRRDALPDGLVEAIKERIANDREPSQDAIARKFRVSPSKVQRLEARLRRK
jgi:hypothetical protein